MPIVSHTHTQSTLENGSTYNVLRMYDQDAREYTQTWNAPPGFDNAGRVAIAITDMDEALKEGEFNALIGADNAG